MPTEEELTTEAAVPEASLKRTRSARGKGSQLRIDLLDAATRVLSGLGSDEALSLRAVARAAGVAPNAVYLHFTDRDDLIMATLERLFAELSELRDRAEHTAAQRGGGAWAQLEARTLAYVRWGLEQPGAYRVLYAGRAVPRLENPRSLTFGQGMLDRTIELIEELERDRLAKPAFRPERAGLLVWAACHGIVSLQIDKDTIEWPSAEELALQALTALVNPTLASENQAHSVAQGRWPRSSKSAN